MKKVPPPAPPPTLGRLPFACLFFTAGGGVPRADREGHALKRVLPQRHPGRPRHGHMRGVRRRLLRERVAVRDARGGRVQRVGEGGSAGRRFSAPQRELHRSAVGVFGAGAFGGGDVSCKYVYSVYIYLLLFLLLFYL